MRSGQKRTARRRGVTFRALVVLPFCVALGIQGVVCATVLARSEILKQMEIDAYDLFSERVASRAGYLENDMIFRWSDFDPVVESATASIDKALAAAQATSADIETGSDLAISIIEATSQDLLAYSHRAEVDGVFLVLADGAEGQSDNRTALYIRDSNPKVEVANGSDLMLAACPISIGRQLGVTLDSMWSATFPLAAEGESRSAFYYEPVRAAERYPEASTNDLGYWGRPVDFGWAGTPSITYSKPIRDAQGGIVGVIGVEVRLDRVASFFPYRDLASSGNSLLSMIMQLSMSIGVTIAGLLLGMFGQQHIAIDSGSTHSVFMYTWLCIAFIIALPAIIFARVPNDTQTNAVISRRKRST